MHAEMRLKDVVIQTELYQIYPEICGISFVIITIIYCKYYMFLQK